MLRQVRSSSSIGEAERREIIEEYLKGGKSKAEIWRHYTGRTEEHGQIIRWMRKLGYIDRSGQVNHHQYHCPMPSEKSQQSVEELQQRIRELEQKLLDSQLKEEAYRRMIDIAEKELKISIQKKSDTK